MTSQGKLEHIIYLVREYEKLSSESPSDISSLLSCGGQSNFDELLQAHEVAVADFKIRIKLETERVLARIAGIMEVPNEGN